ncbi:hypothetical protein [Streptomyces sp. NBC_00035]|uniref:hypothetical protein n=1 Tax=Streptomyces sp. NBC_00035 TaxID=2903614 RepID=UPI00324C14BA
MIERNSKTTISIEIDPSNLTRVPASHLAMLWHVVQANPAPYDDQQAGELAAKVGHEIIRRWLASTEPEMHHHQDRSYYWANLCRFASYRDGDWVPDPDKLAKLEQPTSPEAAHMSGYHLPDSEYLYCGADLDRNEPPHTCNRQIAHKGPCSPERDPEGCPRNVIDGDAGGHFLKKSALSDSPQACVYCGAKKPEAPAGGDR